ncbi:MAG: anti-sigma factor [Gemmatimonadales bacterium]
MNDPIDEMRDLAEDFALGMLEGDQLRAFEGQLLRDTDLQAEVASARDALADMGFAIPVRPAPELRDRVMQSVRPAAAPSAPVTDIATRRRGVGVGTWMAITAIAASAVVIAKLSYDLRDVREVAAAAEVRVAQRDLQIAERDSLIVQLADPNLESISLTSATGRAPGVRVYIDRRRGVAMVSAAAIEAVPAGEAYQLWFIVAGNPAPVPSVTFQPDSMGSAIVQNVRLPEGVVTATAITREPAAGSPAPTSAVIFAGSFDTR